MLPRTSTVLYPAAQLDGLTLLFCSRVCRDVWVDRAPGWTATSSPPLSAQARCGWCGADL